jgi:type IV secretion system protein VirB11
MQSNNAEVVAYDVLPADTTVQHLLTSLQLRGFLERTDVTDIFVNKPGWAFLDTTTGVEKHEVPSLTFEKLYQLANAIAILTKQNIEAKQPIMSAMLPGGERIQVLVPPVVPAGTVSLTIRIPKPDLIPMERYVSSGLFEEVRRVALKNQGASPDDLSRIDRKLLGLLDEKAFDKFFIEAVRGRKNIAIVGDTGSGKTTFMKTLATYIPAADRILTIEDVRELFMSEELNKVHMTYSKGGQGVAQVTPADLLSSSMRMKPDRILLAELRGGEAYDFLNLLTTGHSGSLTSYHADSPALAFERYALMARENEKAAAYSEAGLRRLVLLTIDVIAHVTAEWVFDENDDVIGKRRYMTQIYFDPYRKQQIAFE